MSSLVEFAATELHLELTPAQAEMLASFEASGASQAVWRCGRRGGKSTLADVIALYDVAARPQLRRRLRPWETRVSAVISPRLEQSRTHIDNLLGLVQGSPLLAKMLKRASADELRFNNRSVIRAYPASARGIRGDAWSCVVLDELAHFLSSDEGNAAGDRILEAAIPALAQFGSDGWLVAISTPRWRDGAFWKLCQRAEGGAAGMHTRHLSTAEMNPRIDPAWLEAQRIADADLFRREFGAEFVDGASSYLRSVDVLAAQRRGGTLRPRDGVTYVGALDPAYAMDAFAMAIGHRDDDGRTIIDGVWSWRRQGHDPVLDAVADLAKAYRLRRLRTDQASPVPIREGLQRRGVACEYVPWTNATKVDAYAALKTGLSTRSLELPRDDALAAELAGLEARPTPSGFTRIAAAGSGHDDVAIAVAAVAVELAPRRTQASLYLEHWRREAAAVRSPDPAAAVRAERVRRHALERIVRSAQRHGAAAGAVPSAAGPRCPDPGGHRWRRGGGSGGADVCVLCHGERPSSNLEVRH